MDQRPQPRPNLLLKRAREQRNWTQVQVATKIGMQPDTVGKWERGVDTPSLYARQKLCELFGMSAAELGLGQGREEPADAQRSRPLGQKELPFPPIWNVPFDENPFFTGREQVLHQLHAALLSQDAVVVTQTLSGLGGIGKTQVAVQYCYRYRQDYQAILWVRADSPEVLVGDLRALATLLKLPESKLKEQQSILNGLRRWMREQSTWLLIIDNVENMEMLKNILPPARRGHIVVTTRTQITGTFPKIALQDMSPDEGALLLLRRANMLALGADPGQIPEDEFETARLLSHTLGGLALALDQAGAYIQETGCGFGGYLELYERKRAELLKYRGDLSGDYPASVATTWSLSFEKVKQASATAADVLYASAFLHPDAIPEELFTEGSKDLGPTFQDLLLGKVSLDQVMTALLRYTLLERNSRHRTLRIHRLVQAVLIDAMDQETQRLWAERVVKAVSSCLHLDVMIDQPQQRYALQSQECVKLVTTWTFRFVEAARIICAAGRYLYLDGYYAQAETLCSRALTMLHSLPEASAEGTYICLTSLVVLKIDHGNLLEAEGLGKHLLAESEKHFGSEHIMTAHCLYLLANISMQRELFDQAETLILHASAIFQSVPSAQHVPTTEILVSLAKIYNHQGRSMEAEKLFQEALLCNERMYGPQHPRVANVLDELAIYYASHEKPEEAEQLRKRALGIYTHSLHDEHPDTARTLAGLSVTAFSLKQYDQAEQYYEQALAIWERKLRPKRSFATPEMLAASLEHTIAGTKSGQTCFILFEAPARTDRGDEIATRLAETLFEQKKYDEAGELLWYARDLAVKMRGGEHQITMYCTGNLARFYHLQKEYDFAGLLYQRATQLAGEVDRFRSPGAIQIAENCIQLFRESGRERQAEELERGLEDVKKFRG
jgi:tetratricopeptide (TPR) repeat protein/transcriptional regulator with XRE-family HTH domain